MLSELHLLSRNLLSQGIEVDASHKDLGPPGLTRPSLKVTLLPDGQVAHVSAILLSDAPALWTLKNYNFNFFPAVRVDQPLFDLPVDDVFWNAKLSCDEICDAIDRHADRAHPFHITDGVTKQADGIRGWLNVGNDRSIEHIATFAIAFLFFVDNAKRSASQFVEAAKKILATANRGTIKAVAIILFGKNVAPKGKVPKIECKAQLFFDLQLPDDIFFSIYTPRTRATIRRRLLMEVGSTVGRKPLTAIGICGLELSPCELLSGRMPQWRASKVITKDVVPFSKFSEAKCNYRYGRAGSGSFPLGQDTAQALVGTLKWITDEDRLGKTWRPIRNGKLVHRQGRTFEEEDLLIAYPSADAESLALVRLFAPSSYESDIDPATAEKDFADVSETVLISLREKAQAGRIADWIRLLLIRSVSKGQIQLAHMAAPTITELTVAVEAWRRSEGNLPQALRIPVPSSNTKGGLGWFRPKLLFPEQISRQLTYQWIRNGTESSRVEAPPIGLIFELFLRKQGVWEQHAAQLLETILARASPLLIGAGHLLHHNPRHHSKDWFESWLKLFPSTKNGKPDWMKPQAGWSLINSISLIGSLLYLMNSTVDQYTNESAYLLGRLLAMMDELHRCYCVAERNGDIPSSLIGNGLLGRAAESPAQAIEELLDRSRIYIGWAKTAEPHSDKGKEKARIAVFSARKVLRLAAPLSAALHAANALDEELTAVCKAHLFLGYLSPVLGNTEDKENADVAIAQENV